MTRTRSNRRPPSARPFQCAAWSSAKRSDVSVFPPPVGTVRVNTPGGSDAWRATWSSTRVRSRLTGLSAVPASPRRVSSSAMVRRSSVAMSSRLAPNSRSTVPPVMTRSVSVRSASTRHEKTMRVSSARAKPRLRSSAAARSTGSAAGSAKPSPLATRTMAGRLACRRSSRSSAPRSLSFSPAWCPATAWARMRPARCPRRARARTAPALEWSGPFAALPAPLM